MPITEKTFRIKYRDPNTGEIETTRMTFRDDGTITAKEYAEDEGYALADKGWYSVEEIPEKDIALAYRS